VKTILILDDNDSLINKLSLQLTSDLENTQILTAKSYKDGLKYILDTDVTIIQIS
jgi:hypothetical protein